MLQKSLVLRVNVVDLDHRGGFKRGRRPGARHMLRQSGQCVAFRCCQSGLHKPLLLL